MTEKETDVFLAAKVLSKDEPPKKNCCLSKHTRNCCIASGVFAIIFLVLGILALLMGKGFLEEKILKSMALTDGSDRFESWLRPPVETHLYGYAFHVKNPEAILRGGKPIVEEKGPYVYSSQTIKDADNNIVWHVDDTLTYRPRKLYKYEPSLSGPGLDPNADMITVPNIPLWTGLNAAGRKGALNLVRDTLVSEGKGTPFVTVTFNGLLWGYEDSLPCLKLKVPAGCQTEGDPFGGTDSDSEDEDFGFDMEDEWKRKKRSADDNSFNPDKDPNSVWYGLAKPSAEFVNCSCQWGLFRDRNVTMRKPIRFMTGVSDLARKGLVTVYDGKKELNFWKKGSVCDKVKGQDSSTLPPGLTRDKKLEIFIDLMCRTTMLEYEKDMVHADINTLRYIPTINAFGAHDDNNITRRNEENECYCLKDENFKCFKSGVYSMEPCKREKSAPLALSMPHFYQADESYLEAINGLSPDKEKHQFFIDVVPEFGFPLAIRPRFQLNVVIGRSVDPGWDTIKGMREEIIFPFLWAQDGFDEPSVEMAEAIRFGLEVPNKLPLLVAVIFFVLGAVLLICCLAYFLWIRMTKKAVTVNMTPMQNIITDRS